MSGHTSKWTAVNHGYGEGWSIYGRDQHGDYLIAEKIGVFADDDESEAEAKSDARLIASAPDLLAALTRLLATTDNANTERHDPGCGCVFHEARAAITRADGGGA